MCQAQIDGIPNVHVLISFGEPKISFPMTAPGPIPKNNQAIVIIQAAGLRLCLFAGNEQHDLIRSHDIFVYVHDPLSFASLQKLVLLPIG